MLFVASFTDAWIETDTEAIERTKLYVASFTDAWIETLLHWVRKKCRKSHLLQMRGLKQKVDGKILCHHRVASFTDAWIETFLICLLETNKESHLLQMRGLKPATDLYMKFLLVASFTDAWIETKMKRLTWKSFFVASFTDAWIETKRGTTTRDIGKSHLLQMRGLKLIHGVCR